MRDRCRSRCCPDDYTLQPPHSSYLTQTLHSIKQQIEKEKARLAAHGRPLSAHAGVSHHHHVHHHQGTGPGSTKQHHYNHHKDSSNTGAGGFSAGQRGFSAAALLAGPFGDQLVGGSGGTSTGGKRIESLRGDGGYYLVSKTIGHGAYAVVKLAQQHPSGKLYAAKIFDKTRSNWDSRKKLVYREV